MQGIAIDQFKVVDLESLGCVFKEVVARGIEIGLGSLFAIDRKVAGGEESASKAGCVGAMLRSQVGITRGEGEAVRFAHGFHAMNLDRQGEVADEPANDGELLEVLLAKEDVRGA